MYLWADGIHMNIRLEEHKLCLLVMIGSAPMAARAHRPAAATVAQCPRGCAGLAVSFHSLSSSSRAVPMRWLAASAWPSMQLA